MPRQTAREIDQAAADWAARADRGLTAEEEAGLDTWLAGDVRRPGAYARMRAAALESHRAAALGPHYDPSDFAPTRNAGPSRRRVMLAGGGLLAAGVGGLAVLGPQGLNSERRYATHKGEMRQVALEDGSVVTLNTDSRLSVRFTRTARKIELTQGEALFDVAKDPDRPFTVAAGLTLARAVGTSFTVARLADRPVQVLVGEGVVEVGRQRDQRVTPVRIGANTRAIDPGLAPGEVIVTEPVDENELRRELAWRDGRIAFEGATLQQAASEFARYSDIAIIVTDPVLGRQEIAGLYQSNDPVGFAKAVAESLNAYAEVVDGAVRIGRLQRT